MSPKLFSHYILKIKMTTNKIQNKDIQKAKETKPKKIKADTKEKQEKPSRFRLQGKKFFLTYPQCDTTKEQAMDNVKEYFKDDKGIYVVAHEKHEDGGNHLHIYVEITNKHTITNPNAFDVLGCKHGNYKTIGVAREDRLRVLRYVIKDDDYIEMNIDTKKVIKDMSNPKTSNTKSVNQGEAKIVTDKIMSGTEYDDILKEHPTYCLNNGRKIKEFMADWRNRKEYDDDDLPQELYKWQQDLIDYIQDKPDPRKVKWIVDEVGNTGKSTMRNLLVKKYNAFYATGKCQDMYYAYNKQPIVIFDIPRTQEGHVNYTAIEEFKGGMVFSTKYESRAKIFKKPHVIVFSNFEPDYEAMSMDRWDVQVITKEDCTSVTQENIEDDIQEDDIQEIITRYNSNDLSTIGEEYIEEELRIEDDTTLIQWDDIENAYVSNNGRIYKEIEDIPVEYKPHIVKPKKVQPIHINKSKPIKIQYRQLQPRINEQYPYKTFDGKTVYYKYDSYYERLRKTNEELANEKLSYRYIENKNDPPGS